MREPKRSPDYGRPNQIPGSIPLGLLFLLLLFLFLGDKKMETQMHRRIDILEEPSQDQTQKLLELETSDDINGWISQSQHGGLVCIYAPTP